MFDRYYCIKTNCDTWKFEIFEENERVNLYFLRLKTRGNGTFTACVLKTPLPGQIPTSCWRHDFTFATMHATDTGVSFYDGPGMHTVKAAKQVYNNTRIDLLKHGFVLVKTWLLIACSSSGICGQSSTIGSPSVSLVKDFILLCETLSRLVLYGCSFTLFLCCQVLD